MSKAIPWNIKGVDSRAREVAREAARRAGLTLGEWLNDIIAEHASELGVSPGEVNEEERLEAVTSRLVRLANRLDEGSRKASLRRPHVESNDASRFEREGGFDDFQEECDEGPTNFDREITRGDQDAAINFSRDERYIRDRDRYSRAEVADFDRSVDHRLTGKTTSDVKGSYRRRHDFPMKVSTESASIRDPEAFIDTAIARMSRDQANFSDDNATRVLNKVAHWLELDESRHTIEHQTLKRLANHVETIEQEVKRTLADPQHMRDEGLQDVARRLDKIESLVSQPASDIPDTATVRALQRLEGRLDVLAKSTERPKEVVAGLREIDSKIEALNKRLHLVSSDMRVDEFLPQERELTQRRRHDLGRDSTKDFGKDHGKSSLINPNELSSASPSRPQSLERTPGHSKATLSEMVGQVRKRQRALEGMQEQLRNLEGRTPAPSVEIKPEIRDASENHNYPTSALEPALMSPKPQFRPTSLSANEISSRLQAITQKLVNANKIVQDEQRLQQEEHVSVDLKADFKALARKLSELKHMSHVSAKKMVGPVASPLEAITAQLRHDIATLTSAISQIAPKAAIAALEESMRDLSRRIEQSRDAGVQEKLLKPVENIAAELHLTLRDLDPRPALNLLQKEINAVNRAIESMGGQEYDRGKLVHIEAQMQEMRDMVRSLVDRSNAIDKIEVQIAALSDRVEKISTIPTSPARPTLADLTNFANEFASVVKAAIPPQAFDSINGQLELLDAKINEAMTQASGGAHLADLSLRMEEVQRTLEKAAPSVGPDLRPFEQMLQEIALKLEDGKTGRDVVPAMETLEAQLNEISRQLQQTDEGVNSLSRQVDLVNSRMSAHQTSGQSDSAGQARLDKLLRELSTRLDENHVAPLIGQNMTQVESQLDMILQKLERSDRGVLALSQTTNSQFDALTNRIDAVQTLVSRQVAALQNGSQQISPPNLEALEDLVAGLSDKIESFRGLHPSMEVLTALEAQVSDIAARLERQPAVASLEWRGLEDGLRLLAEKVQAASAPDASVQAIEALESQVMRLIHRLEVIPSSAPDFSQFERAIVELAGQVENGKATAMAVAELAARQVLQEVTRGSIPTGSGVSDEIATIRKIQDEAERRHQNTLHQVHDTLEQVVGRLSSIEGDIVRHGDREVEAPRGSSVSTANNATSARVNESSLEIRASREDNIPKGESITLVVDDEFLIEPSVASNTSRIATKASDSGSDTKAGNLNFNAQKSFIDVARRAAQTVHAETVATVTKQKGSPIRAPKDDGKGLSVEGAKWQIVQRAKPVLLGLAAMVLLVGAVGVVFLRPEGKNTLLGITKSETTQTDASGEPDNKSNSSGSSDMPSSNEDGGSAPDGQQPVPRITLPDSNNDVAPGTGKGASLQNPSKSTLSANIAAYGIDPDPVASFNKLGLPNSQTPATIVSEEKALLDFANNGNAVAQYEMGMRAYDNRDGQRNAVQAIKWFEKAANQGMVPALYQLGVIYERGTGEVSSSYQLGTNSARSSNQVPADPDKARGYYRQAAERGNARAMHNLAVMVADPTYGKADYAGAIVWFSKAAELGVRDSQYNLAILYARGLGVPPDLVSSYMWFAILADQGDNEAAKKRDEIGSHLDNNQLVIAKQKAANFRPMVPNSAVNQVEAPPGGWGALAQADLKSKLSATKIAP